MWCLYNAVVCASKSDSEAPNIINSQAENKVGTAEGSTFLKVAGELLFFHFWLSFTDFICSEANKIVNYLFKYEKNTF